MSPTASTLRRLRTDEPIAVTICTKNRPGYLAALLASLVNQTYPNWMLLINDQSSPAVEEDDTVKDLLQLMRTRGQQVALFRSADARTRYQRVMEAVPAGLELILRVDDDVLLTPTFVEKILRPYHFFPDRPLAAVGPCLPEPHMKPLPLERHLGDPAWVPRIDRPAWALQAHAYTTHEIVEVESLWGSAMCYRRSAAAAVGGWAIEGHSEQVYREDSDMSARLIAAGYELMVSTEALGWHLVAPSGGSRTYRKSPRGNVLVSDRRPFEQDDEIFRARLRTLLAAGVARRDLRRHRITDLEAGAVVARPLVSWKRRVLRWGGRQKARLSRRLR